MGTESFGLWFGAPGANVKVMKLWLNPKSGWIYMYFMGWSFEGCLGKIFFCAWGICFPYLEVALTTFKVIIQAEGVVMKLYLCGKIG